jgi:hypothetical protein
MSTVWVWPKKSIRPVSAPPLAIPLGAHATGAPNQRNLLVIARHAVRAIEFHAYSGRAPSEFAPSVTRNWPTIDCGALATWAFSRHSHSIISQPLNLLFRLQLCAARRLYTVRHTAETDRWRAIDPDRSRKTPQHVLSYLLLPHPNAFRPRPVLPSNTISLTVGHTTERDRWIAVERESSRKDDAFRKSERSTSSNRTASVRYKRSSDCVRQARSPRRPLSVRSSDRAFGRGPACPARRSRSDQTVLTNYPHLARRICSGVCPVSLRRTFVKWEASENPARRPISAVVKRSKSGD